ncbi:S-methyl-5-thioribose-1-phosphate isomerase [Haloplanus sp. GCM10025708]|uniref:S-methyl-5-thioribose-1-phosphate isomerase n=1 Tax=Haloplanus sp. GCM10025708 TaxID=3252679 RepID=UPI0036187428
MRTIEWDDDRDCVAMVDQTRLPAEFTTYHAETVTQLVESIQRLRVRGAPALGAAGAFGVALAARERSADTLPSLREGVHADADRIAAARPTAVNLSREVEALRSVVDDADSAAALRERTLDRAKAVADADVKRNRAIGDHGATLLEDGWTVLTHCNAGALATVDWGTALGVVYSARAAGKRVSVVATETRPLNQGSRITTVELADRGVEVTLVPDSASGRCLQRGTVDAVIVGADRVVLDGGSFGDGGVVFNKVGTYNHAVLAARHDVPFVVAAPTSTIDADSSADDVEIEERDPAELRYLGDRRNAPDDVPVYNPAFDATPTELVDYLVTERGVFEPPLARETLLPAVANVHLPKPTLTRRSRVVALRVSPTSNSGP